MEVFRRVLKIANSDYWLRHVCLSACLPANTRKNAKHPLDR